MKRIGILIGSVVGVCGILLGIYAFVFGDVAIADIVGAPGDLKEHLAEFKGHEEFCDAVHEDFRAEQLEQTKILYQIKGKLDNQ